MPEGVQRRVTRRVAQLLSGLTLCAVGITATLQAELGVSPWDVLHGGLADRLDLPFGYVVQGVGVVVLAGGMLLGGVRPGWGTIANIALIGTVENILLDSAFLDGLADDAWALRVVVLVVGVATIGLGCALYIGAHLGAGPRDSLMVGLHQRARIPVGAARAVVEAVALVTGMVLGGPVGAGTVVYVVGIGPAVQASFRLLGMTPARLPETTTEAI